MMFPSDQLYDKKLVGHSSVSNRILADLLPILSAVEDHPVQSQGPKEDGDSDGLLSEPIIFYDTAGAIMYERTEDSDNDKTLKRSVERESKRNENEADLVMRFVDELVRDRRSKQFIKK